MNRRNFGFGRRMDFAGKQVLRERYGGGHFGTVAAHADRWAQFCKFAATAGVKDMRNVDCPLVEKFAANLQGAVSTKQNLISSINTVMLHASSGTWSAISPRSLCGARNNIRTTVPASLNRDHHDKAVASMRAAGLVRGAAMADLARAFGVRGEEAAKADLSRWMKEANAEGKINIQDGCKGGRTADRWVVVDDRGREALEAAVAARPLDSRNLLSSDESYAKARAGWIRQGREAYSAATRGRGIHDARAGFACERYQQLTAKPAPIVTGGHRTAESATDLDARKVVAVELGHNRVDVLCAYIGGRR